MAAPALVPLPVALLLLVLMMHCPMLLSKKVTAAWVHCAQLQHAGQEVHFFTRTPIPQVQSTQAAPSPRMPLAAMTRKGCSCTSACASVCSMLAEIACAWLWALFKLAVVDCKEARGRKAAMLASSLLGLYRPEARGAAAAAAPAAVAPA